MFFDSERINSVREMTVTIRLLDPPLHEFLPQEKEDLKIGICGEQGGEPSSIDFWHRKALNYVSS